MNHFENIIYVEDEDLSKDGILSKQVLPDDELTTALLFVYADFCPHCTDIKPVFQEFANSSKGRFIPLVLKVDGSSREYSVVLKLKELMSPTFKGIPVFFGIKNRKVVKMISGHEGRNVKLLTEFVQSL